MVLKRKNTKSNTRKHSNRRCTTRFPTASTRCQGQWVGSLYKEDPCPVWAVAGVPMQWCSMYHGQWSHGEPLSTCEKTNRHDWKYYLHATSVAAGKYELKIQTEWKVEPSVLCIGIDLMSLFKHTQYRVILSHRANIHRPCTNQINHLWILRKGKLNLIHGLCAMFMASSVITGCVKIFWTRMHSSRMRTTLFSDLPWDRDPPDRDPMEETWDEG